MVRPSFLYSMINCLSSWAVTVPRVSLPLWMDRRSPAPVLWNKAYWCSVLLPVPQLMCRFSSQNPTDLPPLFSSCSLYCLFRFYAVLYHICVVLISPVRLHLHTNPLSLRWRLCWLPPLLLSASTTPLQPFFFAVWSLLFVNVLFHFLFSLLLLFLLWMSWDALTPYFPCLLTSDQAKESETRQLGLCFITAICCWQGSFISNCFTLFLPLSQSNYNPYFSFFIYILEQLEQSLMYSIYSLNICWMKE